MALRVADAMYTATKGEQRRVEQVEEFVDFVHQAAVWIDSLNCLQVGLAIRLDMSDEVRHLVSVLLEMQSKGCYAGTENIADVLLSDLRTVQRTGDPTIAMRVHAVAMSIAEDRTRSWL